jgi:enediyne biosynthesis protein E4
VPAFKKKFTDYKSYSMATISDVLTPEELRRSQKAEVTTLESCYFKNIDNHFEMMPLPVNFQFAPIFALAAADFNNDGKLDILSGGNLTATRARTGKLTGNYGMMAYGSGDGNFSPRSYSESGLKLKGDVRHMIYTKGVLLVAVNNGGIIKYKINNK